MLNLKKVIASICVLAMVLSTVAFGATYTDVAEDSAYYEAVETLNKLEIVTGYEDGTYKPEDGVTRAEMAALIARIQGYGDTAKGSANTGFTDVPASHWASGYIANAAGMGIINGYGDGTFGPEDPVLYEQAVKMVMATLGYTPFAEKNGGYPTGYLAAAQRYSVSLAVANAAVGQEANRGTVAQLLENALDTPLMIQSAWNTNGEVEYIIADGTGERTYRTLMSENLGYVKIRGIVTDNTVANLDGTKSIDTTKDAEVIIDILDAYKTTNKDFEDLVKDVVTHLPKTILVGGTDVEDYLGQSVIGYVKKLASDKYEMVSVAVDTNRNEVLTVNLADFAGVDQTKNEILYYKDGANDKSAAKYEDDAVTGQIDLKVIFNGLGGFGEADIYDGSDASKILGKNLPLVNGGEIVLIDNDDVRGYDVAFINMAATAVVKKVTANGIALYNGAELGRVANTATKTIYVYPEDETRVVEIVKDGEVIDYTELQEWDVLSVYAASSTAKYITAEVISEEVIGTITSQKTSKTSDYSQTAFKVGDNWYDVAAGAYVENPEVGVGGKFYIDQFGKIAAFIEDSALAGGVAGNYGYVKAVAAEEKSFGSTGIDVKIQMLTENGLEVFAVKNNAKFYKSNGSNVSLDVIDWTWEDTTLNPGKVDASELSGGNYAEYANVAALAGEVVKFTKDSNGYIGSIIEVGYSKAGSDAELTAGSYVEDKEFDADSFRFETAGYITEDALVFVVDSDEAKCKVATAADFSDKTDYDVTLYTTKGSEDADIVVVSYSSFATAGASASLAVVTGISTGSDDEGNTNWTITYLQDGEEFTYETIADVYDNGALRSGLTIGDAVKVKLAGDLITNIEFVFNFAENVRAAGAVSGSNSVTVERGTPKTDEIFAYGVVREYKDNSEVAVLDETTGGTGEVKLGRAINYYTIDNTGYELKITADGGSSFTNLSDVLYDGLSRNVKFVDEDGTAVSGCSNLTELQAQEYADYVYVRSYDNKPVDVIVVKGAKDIIVQETGSVSITYDANGGTGHVVAQTGVAINADATTAVNAFSREGYTFVKWNTEANGSGVSYNAGAAIKPEENMTLYAIWAENPVTVTFKAGANAGSEG